jgi:hypothetical protein
VALTGTRRLHAAQGACGTRNGDSGGGMTRLGITQVARLAFSAAALLSSTAVHAQSAAISLEDDVLSRPKPEYDAHGVTVGNFTILPSLAANLNYDSDLYSVSKDKTSDGYIALLPDLRIKSAPGVIQGGLDLNGNIQRFFNTKIQDTDLYNVLGNLAYQSGDTNIALSSQYQRSAEPRGSAGDTVIGGAPVTFRQFGGQGTINQSFGRLQIAVNGSVDRVQYDDQKIDGISLSQSFRDETQWLAGVKVGWSFAGQTALFVSATRSGVTYSSAIESGSDTRGYAFLTGVDFGITSLLTGTIGAGYLIENFSGDQYSSVKGLTYNANVKWTPSTLLTINIGATKALQRTPEVGVAGIIYSTFNLSMNYELLRSIILIPSISYERDTYKGASSTSNRVSGGLEVRYLTARGVEFKVSAQARKQDASGGAARGYSAYTVTTGIVLRR